MQKLKLENFDFDKPIVINSDALKLFQDIQGNILKGFPNTQSMAFVSIELINSFKPLASRWISEFANSYLTTEFDRFKATQDSVSYGLFLTQKGFVYFCKEDEIPHPPIQYGEDSSDLFREVNNFDKHIEEQYSEKTPNLKLQKGYECTHVIVVVAAPGERQLKAAVSNLNRRIRHYGKIRIVAGMRRPNSVQLNEKSFHKNHFDYAEGFSQPLFYQEEIDEVYHRDNTRVTKNTLRWPRAAAPNMVLVPEKRTGSYGSYVALLQVGQNEDAFYDLKSSSKDKDLVGRTQDGKPFSSRIYEESIAAWDDFNYSKMSASNVPETAHIRVANPRGKGDQDKRIVRRGISYDLGKEKIKIQDYWNSNNDNGTRAIDEPSMTLQKGLYFVSYQANLSRFMNILDRAWQSKSHPEKNDQILGTNLTEIFGGTFAFAPSKSFLLSIGGDQAGNDNGSLDYPGDKGGPYERNVGLETTELPKTKWKTVFEAIANNNFVNQDCFNDILEQWPDLENVAEAINNCLPNGGERYDPGDLVEYYRLLEDSGYMSLIDEDYSMPDELAPDQSSKNDKGYLKEAFEKLMKGPDDVGGPFCEAFKKLLDQDTLEDFVFYWKKGTPEGRKKALEMVGLTVELLKDFYTYLASKNVTFGLFAWL